MESMKTNPYHAAYNVMEYYQMILHGDAHTVFQWGSNLCTMHIWHLHNSISSLKAAAVQMMGD